MPRPYRPLTVSRGRVETVTFAEDVSVTGRSGVPLRSVTPRASFRRAS